MSGFEGFSDEQLIERMQSGEKGIAEYLIDKYKGLVRRKARAVFLVGGETDDLIQEGMIGLFKALQDYDPDREASFQTFARLCVDRQLYTAVRSAQRQKHMPLNGYVSLSEDEQVLFASEETEPESYLIARESQESMTRRVREALSPLENQVLTDYLMGMPNEAIAADIGRPLKSVENALHRIRVKIRKEIKNSEEQNL
ncbi:MAG: sigma-70 family RNA polymerase sigma factor [Blautia sp.]|nr:sigma-70 family RNA polymerase sigma factor [Blautia sp.]